MPTGMCWWRFKGEKAYRFGYATRVSSGLFRMGYWNGDTTNGSVVDPLDIEWKEYR